MRDSIVLKLFLCVLCFFSVEAEEIPDRWILKQGSIQQLTLQQEQQLLGLFQCLGIDVEPIPADKWESVVAEQPSIALPVEPQKQWSEARVLWTGKTVKLISSEEGRLRITPIRCVKWLDELSLDERLEVETLAIKMSEIFRRVFGSADYIRWIPLGSEAGQVGDQLYSELIPTGAGQVEELNDVEIKVRTNLYLLMGKGSLCPGVSGEQLDQIQKTIQEVQETCQPQIMSLERQKCIHVGEAGRLLAIALLQWLNEHGAAAIPIAKSHSHLRNIPEIYSQSCQTCAFCDVDVIGRQLIYDGKDCAVLSDYKPYMATHWMTIPKAHTGEGVAKLAPSQLLEKFRLWIRIQAIYRHALKYPAMAIITRSGSTAGQTVPHNHDHVVAMSSDCFPTWILRCFDDPLLSLTQETMKSTRDTYGSLFDPIDTVIFDFGGVVVGVGNDPLKQAQFIADTLHIPLDAVLDNFAKDIVSLGKGEIDEEGFWEKFAHQYGGSVPRDWMKLWRDFYHSCNPLDEKTVAIIQQLQKRGFRTPLISDTIPSHAQFNREHGYYDFFDPVILSHEVHIRKPDPSIFHLLLDRIRTTPSRCLFVDDLMRNVEAAQKIGMHSIHFKSAERLEQELMPFLQCVNK